MKYLSLLLLFCLQAHAQYSVVETDASNRFRLLGQQWTPSFFSLASLEPDKVQEGPGRLSTYNYLTFGTFVGDNLRFKVRIPFTYSTAGTDRFGGDRATKAEFQMQDLILNWQSSDFWILPYDIGTYWEGRLYLPTSKFSMDSGKIASLRNEFIFTKMFTRDFGFEYDQKVMYHLQSRTVYQSTFENENGFTVNAPSLTKQAELVHWLNAWYKFNTKVSTGWRIGMDETWFNHSTAENRSKPSEHLIFTGPSVRFPIGRSANFLLGYDDKVDLNKNRKEFGRFLAKNTQVTLLSFISF